MGTGNEVEMATSVDGLRMAPFAWITLNDMDARPVVPALSSGTRQRTLLMASVKIKARF